MTNIVTDSQIIDDLLARHISEVIPNKDELKKRLLSGQRLRIYQGFDPTAPNLHIGHLVGILTLKIFQDLGHEVIFLIGDFTARIGDPTGKDKTRVPLTEEQVKQNAQTYRDQIKSILKFDGENPALVKFNSEWLSQMKMEEVLKFAMNFTTGQILERDMFQKRIAKSKPISLHELLYPVLVTKDAIAMDVDLELGGFDQLFNMSVGRHVIKATTGKDKFAIATQILADSTGKKIGKTEGNAINIAGKPEDLYGQIMSLTDDAILPSFRLITLVSSLSLTDIEQEIKINPMQQKKKLAWEVVKILHGEEVANQAQSHFEKTVQDDNVPELIPEISIKNFSSPMISLTTILVETGLSKSKSEAKRLIEQGGVKIDNQSITDPLMIKELKPDMIIKAGKRNFRKIV